jgi:hypothetical protein
MTIATSAKNAIAALFRGLLLGAGFAIGFGTLYLTVFPSLSADLDQRMKEATIEAKVRPSDIALSEIQEQRHDDASTITGLATNSSRRMVFDVMLEADLYNHGSFVDQCKETISGPVDPGESRHFKIVCACGSKPPEVHDSYKVAVLGSRWP